MSDQVSTPQGGQGQEPSRGDLFAQALAAQGGNVPDPNATPQGAPNGQGQPQGQQHPSTPPQGQAPAGPSTPQDPNGQDPNASPEVRALRQEAANYRTQLRAVEAERDTLRQASMTEQERAQAQVAQDRQAAADATARIARYEVAAAKGLPLNMADRLRGNTPEELAQDADVLIRDFGLTPQLPGQVPVVPVGVPDFNGGYRQPPNGAADTGMTGLIRAAAGRA